MAESKVRPENYITIQGFMVNGLNLKGNELLVYAIIYGFSQTENQRYTGGLQYLADWTNSSKNGIQKNLKSLVEKGLVVKTDKIINNIKFVEYHTTQLHKAYNTVAQGIQQSCTGYTTELYGGIQHSCTNKINDNIKNNIKDNIGDKKPRTPYEEIKDFYNITCTKLPKITALSNARKTEIKARFEQHGLETIKQVFEIAQGSDFLTGKNPRGWHATFDWLLKDSNFVKVLDGNFNNSSGKTYGANGIAIDTTAPADDLPWG